MDKLKNRKTPRLPLFDYNSVGVYFITICTQNRNCILSRVVGTGVLDCPDLGVLDCPCDKSLVTTGMVLDCPCPELIDRAKIELTPYGEIAQKYLMQLNDFYEHLSVEHYVIMPNHIHLLLFIKENRTIVGHGEMKTHDNGQSEMPFPTMTKAEKANTTFSQFISTFKHFCNKEYGCNIWQARAFDHIIRNREDYEKHVRYIYENPMRWYYDELYSEK